MFITQKDIARDLGISLITVSRAFNNSGYVSEDLKKRILDYAKKKSYVPHRASQVLVRNTIRTIAVFSSTNPEYFWDDIKQGVLNAAEQLKPFNYEVHYHRVPDFDTEKFCALLKREIRNGLNAAAFVNQGIFDMQRIINIAEKAGIPYLMYNVDAPESGRLCYIGSDYRAGGRLAANFIGKALSVKNGGKALVIGYNQEASRYAPKPDINSDRLGGFLSVMKGQYPSVICEVSNLTVNSRQSSAEKQVFNLLAKNEGKLDAVYFIPAFNTAFHHALERLNYRNTLTLMHDMDDSAARCLDENLLTAVIFQDPFFQGYITVRTMEAILESKIQERIKDVEIAHNLIFKENINSVRKYHLLAGADE